jgi:hypothetical protein
MKTSTIKNQTWTIKSVSLAMTISLAGAMLFMPKAHAAFCLVLPTGNLPFFYKTIQAAVNNLNCTIIKVPAGVFKENVIINHNVSIVGAGLSKTFVDGGRNGSVFEVSKNGSVSLKNMAIVNGLAIFGGGINNFGGGRLTVSNCLISGNGLGGGGGGGGGINNSGSTLILQNSFINGNGNSTTNGSVGGGIFNQLGSTSLIQNSVISGNTAGLGGGILNVNGSKLTVQNSFINGNKGGDGGGVYNSGTLTVQNNTVISGNTADNTGGGVLQIQVNGSTLNVDQSSHVIANTPSDVVP